MLVKVSQSDRRATGTDTVCICYYKDSYLTPHRPDTLKKVIPMRIFKVQRYRMSENLIFVFSDPKNVNDEFLHKYIVML